MKGLTCIAHLRTITVLSLNLSIAISVTGPTLSKGKLCFSVNSFKVFNAAPLVKLVTSLVLVHKISNKEALLAAFILEARSSSPSVSSSSPRNKIHPMALTIALLNTYTSLSNKGRITGILLKTILGLTAANSLKNGATFLTPTSFTSILAISLNNSFPRVLFSLTRPQSSAAKGAI
jgi:hypothetical protein